MSTRRRDRRSSERNRSRARDNKGIVIILITFLLVTFILVYNIHLSKSVRKLDSVSLCPVDPLPTDSVTVVLIDISDSLSITQKKDLENQLDKIRDAIPRHGRLEIYTVSDLDGSLLVPSVSLCNPGRGREIDPLTGNPKQVEDKWRSGFDGPISSAIEGLVEKSPLQSSEILGSIQSITLTGLRTRERDNLTHKLVIVSDLMQNTQDANFYKGIPKFKDFQQTRAYQQSMADLKGVDVEIWIISRNNLGQETQLISLWGSILRAQGATLSRIYRI